jgi:2-isopropylmalate synthase
MATVPSEDQLMYDWSAHAAAGPRPGEAMLDDETLRDGLQSPSVTDPPTDVKIKVLHLMDSLGIETADIGLPGAGPRQRDAVERLCREIADCGLRIKANCAARTMIVDIQPIAEVTQKTGVPIEACVFMYVTEDTIRAQPEHLRVLMSAAVEAGAKRLCLCDTVGTAVPRGVVNLVTWVRQLTEELGVGDTVGIDWHGHRDRGLDVANTLAALEAGATRVHGTALGVGERVGNTPMEQLLVNLKLLGWRDDDLTSLPEYVKTVSDAVDVPIAVNTPIVGRDAFRTATGVHAAAVIKAQRRGKAWLADRVYSGVPASWVGRGQEIEVGHMSGASNVIHYLTTRGLSTGDEVVEAVLAAAKKSERLLTEEEILAAVNSVTTSA